jgi:hypothetical protein
VLFASNQFAPCRARADPGSPPSGRSPLCLPAGGTTGPTSCNAHASARRQRGPSFAAPAWSAPPLLRCHVLEYLADQEGKEEATEARQKGRRAEQRLERAKCRRGDGRIAVCGQNAKRRALQRNRVSAGHRVTTTVRRGASRGDVRERGRGALQVLSTHVAAALSRRNVVLVEFGGYFLHPRRRAARWRG